MSSTGFFGKFLVSAAAISLLISGQAIGQELEPKHATVAQVKQILDEDFVGFLVAQARLRWAMKAIATVASDATKRQNAGPTTEEDVRLRSRFKSSMGACIVKAGILGSGLVTAEMKSEVDDAIGAALSESDFVSIMNYYSTDQGRRYRSLLLEDNKIVLSIWENTITLSEYFDDEPLEFRQPFPSVSDRDTELSGIDEIMSLSRQMQIFAIQAQGDTGDLSAMASFGLLKLAYVYHRDDYKKLRKNYQGDLKSFGEFVRSSENKHLVTAMINVGNSDMLKPDMSDISDFISTMTRSGRVDCPASATH